MDAGDWGSNGGTRVGPSQACRRGVLDQTVWNPTAPHSIEGPLFKQEMLDALTWRTQGAQDAETPRNLSHVAGEQDAVASGAQSL